MKNKNEYGIVEISDQAFNDMGNIAVAKVKGVYPAKKNGSICDCSVKDGEIVVNMNIKAKTGVDIVKLSGRLQTKVHEIIEEMTGIDCKQINVNVHGFVN